LATAALNAVVALLVSSRVRGVAVPVTTTASRLKGSDASEKSSVRCCPAAMGTDRV